MNFGTTAAQGTVDTANIERLTGVKGKLNAQEGAFKVSVPRNDLAVTIGPVKMTPAMGLTSWAAFTKSGDRTMVMGDLVLTEGQVNPVMDIALANGLQVTGLHNHFLGDSPKVMFMHIAGMGDEAQLAAAVGKVFAEIKATAGQAFPTANAAIDPKASTFDHACIDAVFGKTGETSDGVYKFTWGSTAEMDGQTLGNTMGVNTWAAFAGGNDQAVVDGDFVISEDELQPVLKALRRAKINIVAIHNHMVGESPRLLFLHFWGAGRTTDLAQGVQDALGQTTAGHQDDE